MGSNFNLIRPLTAELSALERLEKSIFSVVATLAPSFFIRTFFILESNKDIYNISDEFEFRPDPTSDCGVFEKSIFCVVATLAP